VVIGYVPITIVAYLSLKAALQVVIGSIGKFEYRERKNSWQNALQPHAQSKNLKILPAIFHYQRYEHRETMFILYSLLAYAMVLNSAFSAWRESSRVCCTTIGTSDSITLA
jgi:hypothetical protein